MRIIAWNQTNRKEIYIGKGKFLLQQQLSIYLKRIKIKKSKSMKNPINFPTGKYMSSKVLSRKNFPQYFSLLTPLWVKESNGSAQTLRCPGVLQHRSTEQHFYSV